MFIEWYNLDSSYNTLDFSKKTGKIAFYFVRNLLWKWFASKMTISLVYRGKTNLDGSDNTLDISKKTNKIAFHFVRNLLWK